MLKKLLKYELKSTSRIMWILYAAAIACGALLGVIVNLQLRSSGNDSLDLAFSGEGRLQVLSILLIAFIAVYVLLLTAIMVTTFILIIMRFYRNLLLGEGYLMHTLPVEPASLITSKLLVAILWILIAAAAGGGAFYYFKVYKAGQEEETDDREGMETGGDGFETEEE